MGKSLITLVVALSALLVEGCSTRGAPTETAFMRQHVPKTFFQELAEREGLKCIPWSGSSESGGLPCRKQDHIEIEGGLPVRDKAMIAYRAHIREAIVASGATIHGESKRGDDLSLASFDFDYANGTVSGFLYATAVVNHRGNVDIFTVMYEH